MTAAVASQMKTQVRTKFHDASGNIRLVLEMFKILAETKGKSQFISPTEIVRVIKNEWMMPYNQFINK